MFQRLHDHPRLAVILTRPTVSLYICRHKKLAPVVDLPKSRSRAQVRLVRLLHRGLGLLDIHAVAPWISETDARVLTSYRISVLLMDDRWFAFTSRPRFGRTSPLANGRTLGPETGDNGPLSLDDAHSERDY